MTDNFFSINITNNMLTMINMESIIWYNRINYDEENVESLKKLYVNINKVFLTKFPKDFLNTLMFFGSFWAKGKLA